MAMPLSLTATGPPGRPQTRKPWRGWRQRGQDRLCGHPGGGGSKPALVAGGIRRLAGLDWKDAVDLTAATPALVFRDVPAAPASRARDLLVSRGATVLLR